MKEKLKYRQGDILVFQVSEIKQELKEVEQVILAEGEIMGHKHILVADPETKVKIAHDGVGFYLRIEGGEATIKHEEHKPITLTPGSWRVKIQQEYDPITYRRNVLD